LALRWIVLGVILCLLLAALPAAAQEQPAVVRSDRAVIELAPGQTTTVSVVLTEAREVYGIDVRAAFDPQLVEVVDADPAREGVQFTPGTFPQPDFLVRNEADNQAGTLRYAITQVNPTEPANGTGVIFTLQLRARADSGTGSFAVTTVEMSDRDGILLAVQPENALIRVGSGGSGTPSTEPTATPTSVATAANLSTPTPPPAAAPVAASSSAPDPATPTSVAAMPAAPTVAPNLEPTRAEVKSSVDPVQDTPETQPALQALAAPDATDPTAPQPPAPQAVAAALAAESATLDRAPDTAGQTASGQQALAQRPSEERTASAQRSSAVDPSNLLLIAGVVALMMAAVLGVSLVFVTRRR